MTLTEIALIRAAAARQRTFAQTQALMRAAPALYLDAYARNTKALALEQRIRERLHTQQRRAA